MKKILFLLFPFLVVIFLFHYFLVGQAVYGDGIYYWSYVRSLYIDHDLKLNDEISHRYDHKYNNSNINTPIPKEDAARIALEFHLPFGPSIGFLPFFAMGDVVSRISNIFNTSIPLNGYSDIYQITVGIGQIFYFLLGLYFVYLLLKKYFSERISIITTLLLFFATNLFYYGSWDVINSHQFSFFLSSIFTYYFFTKFLYKWYQWIMLGILIGMLILTRTQEITFGIFLIAGIMRYWSTARVSVGKRILSLVGYGILGALGIMIAISPQLLLLEYIYRGLLNSPYVISGSFNFLSPHLIGVLLNSKTGLLFTSPIIIVGIFGLFLMARKNNFIAVLGVILFAIEYYVIASWSFWDQAASYGIRMLISTFPIIALGIAEMIGRISKRYSFKLVYFLGIFLIIFNLAMIIHFEFLVKTATLDVTTVTRIQAQEKLNKLFHTNFKFFKN